jgi:hypothetical protein
MLACEHQRGRKKERKREREKERKREREKEWANVFSDNEIY